MPRNTQIKLPLWFTRPERLFLYGPVLNERERASEILHVDIAEQKHLSDDGWKKEVFAKRFL